MSRKIAMSVRIPAELEQRISRLAKESKKPKTAIVEAAILAGLIAGSSTRAPLDGRDEVFETMNHYFSTLFEKVGLAWTPENVGEISDMTDKMFNRPEAP